MSDETIDSARVLDGVVSPDLDATVDRSNISSPVIEVSPSSARRPSVNSTMDEELQPSPMATDCLDRLSPPPADDLSDDEPQPRRKAEPLRVSVDPASTLLAESETLESSMEVDETRALDGWGPGSPLMARSRSQPHTRNATAAEHAELDAMVADSMVMSPRTKLLRTEVIVSPPTKAGDKPLMVKDPLPPPPKLTKEGSQKVLQPAIVDPLNASMKRRKVDAVKPHALNAQQRRVASAGNPSPTIMARDEGTQVTMANLSDGMTLVKRKKKKRKTTPSTGSGAVEDAAALLAKGEKKAASRKKKREAFVSKVTEQLKNDKASQKLQEWNERRKAMLDKRYGRPSISFQKPNGADHLMSAPAQAQVPAAGLSVAATAASSVAYASHAEPMPSIPQHSVSNSPPSIYPQVNRSLVPTTYLPTVVRGPTTMAQVVKGSTASKRIYLPTQAGSLPLIKRS